MRDFKIVWGVLLLSGMTACGGQSEQTALPSEVSAACAEERRTECTIAESCEGAYSSEVYGSVENCVTRSTQECEHRFVSRGTGYGATEIATCTANQQAQTCDEWIGTLTPGCGFAGKKSNGEHCLFGSQCASGFCDASLYQTERDVCGACATPPAVGDHCTSSCGGDGTVQCEHDPTGAGHCVRLGTIGESCDDVARCATGLGCAVPADAPTGQCLRTDGNEGDPCDDQIGPLCDYRRRIYCNEITHSCETAQLAAPGAACGRLADGSSARCSGGFCYATTPGATAGTCVAYLPDGSSCTFGPGVSDRCEPPALCAWGVCRIVGGELCE